jgi:hypothetical protein
MHSACNAGKKYQKYLKHTILLFIWSNVRQMASGLDSVAYELA